MGENSKYINKASEWVVIHGMDFLVSLVAVLVILIVGKIAIGIICGMLSKTIKKSAHASEILQGFVINVAHKLLWVIVLMIALQRLGIDIAPLIAGLGVTGFIVGFAFQESLGNLAAGLMIALNEPFKVGNFIESGGISGVVRELNMMATTLTTPDNKKVVIPNSKVWGAAITNFSALDTRRVDLIVGISYAADIGKAQEVIGDVVRNNELVLSDPETRIEVVEMADSSINLIVRPWCKTGDYWNLYYQLQKNLKIALDAANIGIPFPQMDVHHYGLPDQANGEGTETI